MSLRVSLEESNKQRLRQGQRQKTKKIAIDTRVDKMYSKSEYFRIIQNTFEIVRNTLEYFEIYQNTAASRKVHVTLCLSLTHSYLSGHCNTYSFQPQDLAIGVLSDPSDHALTKYITVLFRRFVILYYSILCIPDLSRASCFVLSEVRNRS